MNDAQREALRAICARYDVPFDEADYLVHGYDAWMMPGYAEGWVGGAYHACLTIFVGVDPEGRISS